MKKKILFGITSAALAVVMCAGFAACGEGSGADSIQSDIVTEAEWIAAFDESNFTNVKVTATYSEEIEVDGVRITGTGSGVWVVAGDKAHAKWSISRKYSTGVTESEEYEYYYSLDNGVLTTYEKDNDEPWEEEYTREFEDGIFFALSGINQIQGMLHNGGSASNYNLYIYSEKDNGYVFTYNDEVITQTTVLKFKNGKVASLSLTVKGRFEGEETSSTYTEEYVFTYGGQTVTIPADLTK